MSRFTPRVANRLLKRVRDYAQVHSDGTVTDAISQKALALLEIDQWGLEPMDRRVLEVVIHKFKGGPVGLRAIAASAAEEEESLEEVYEPYPMQLGLLERTPRGRMATERAYEHLGLSVPKQKPLLS